MKVAIYARVSTEGQEQRGTIASQIEALRARMAADGHEIVAEFLDDGYSGARAWIVPAWTRYATPPRRV